MRAIYTLEVHTLIPLASLQDNVHSPGMVEGLEGIFTVSKIALFLDTTPGVTESVVF